MEYRYAKRDCKCRGCDKTLKKDVDKAIFMYSIRNKGQHIMLCEDCVGKMFGMVSAEYGKLFPEDRSHWGYSDAGIRGDVKVVYEG